MEKAAAPCLIHSPASDLRVLLSISHASGPPIASDLESQLGRMKQMGDIGKVEGPEPLPGEPKQQLSLDPSWMKLGALARPPVTLNQAIGSSIRLLRLQPTDGADPPSCRFAWQDRGPILGRVAAGITAHPASSTVTTSQQSIRTNPRKSRRGGSRWKENQEDWARCLKRASSSVAMRLLLPLPVPQVGSLWKLPSQVASIIA